MTESNSMGVQIQIDATLTELMEKLGCNSGLMMLAQQQKLSITYALHSVTVSAQDGHAQEVPIKMGILGMILNGTLKPGAACSFAKLSLEKAVKELLDKVTAPAYTESASVDVYSPDLSTAVPAADAVPDLAALFLAVPPVKPVAAQAVGVKQALKDATVLYQPVRGSDTHSTYFAVALTDDLKIAVRIKSHASISIRAEGNLNKYLTRLVGAGFSKTQDTHCSVHLAAESDDLARRTIGAVVMGTGIQFAQLATDLTPIWGVGA